MDSVTEINESQQNEIKGELGIKDEPMSDGEDEMILPDNPDIADVDPLQIDNIKREAEPSTVSQNSRNTGYEAYCRNRKQELHVKFPNMSRSNVMKEVDKEWKKLSDKVKEMWNNLVITPQPEHPVTLAKPRRQSTRARKPKEFKDIPEISETKRKSTRPFKRQYLTITLYPPNYEPPTTLELEKKQEEVEEQNKKEEKRRKPLLRSTGYILWAKEIGESLRKQCPLMTFSEISKHLGEMWRQLPKLEKYNYRRRAKRVNDKIARDLLLAKEEKDKEKEKDDGVTKVSSKGRILAKSKKLTNFCAFKEKQKVRLRKIKVEQASIVPNKNTEEGSSAFEKKG